MWVQTISYKISTRFCFFQGFQGPLGPFGEPGPDGPDVSDMDSYSVFFFCADILGLINNQIMSSRFQLRDGRQGRSIKGTC